MSSAVATVAAVTLGLPAATPVESTHEVNHRGPAASTGRRRFRLGRERTDRTNALCGRAAPALLLALPQAAGAEAFRALDLLRPSRAVVAADSTVPGLTGQPLRLSDFKGTVVFLNFWATWCPPCKEEMPSMERLYRRYKDQGFTILAVSIDGRPPRDGER